jgi:diguanylate cyclase (GGDEF)-like protein
VASGLVRVRVAVFMSMARARVNRERIAALARISTLKERDEKTRFILMLEIAASMIRPGRPFRGSLSHLDHENLVYDAVVWTGSAHPDPAAERVHAGAVAPLNECVQIQLLADGSVGAWNNIATDSALGAMPRVARFGTQSVIGSAVHIGRRIHFIVYSSPESMAADPFTDEDVDFVNVVAKLFSSTFNQLEYVDRLRHQREHDGLTGLANRLQFRRSLRERLGRDEPFAIAIVNLDRYRQINEVHGRMVADEVLVEIAATLSAIEPQNIVARLNGDEFGILLDSLPSADAAPASVERYIEPFRRPFHTGDRDGTRMVSVRASIGWAASPEHGTRAEDLLRRADVALDVAKERGGNAIVVFDPSMDRIIEQRNIAATGIVRAVAGDEFRMMYQPTFDLVTRRIVGAEALIRWDHPDGNEIMPGQFIPIAERNGLIGAISRWVLDRVIRDIEVGGRLPPGFRFYFNLSAHDLEDFSFVTALHEKLGHHPGVAEYLGVEITETTAMQNVEQSLNTLGFIQGLGVRVAIDDFGTGYSSLSYLKRLSVDLIKLDRSFVAGLPHDPQDTALAEMMINICSRFGVTVLAEGIESDAQRAWLQTHGCRFGQGYLFARPLAIEQLLALVAQPVPALTDAEGR